MTNRAKVIVVFVAPLICGLAAAFLGKDTSWDLRNYHYYNAYSFLENRLEFDIAPAQLQTYYNPLLDLPFYWMTECLPSRAIGFILGYVHGLNLSVVFLIFSRLVVFTGQSLTTGVGIAVLLVSGIAPGFISELGGTMNDGIVSLFVLLAILLLFVARDRSEPPKSARRTALLTTIAGLTMGAVVGLKPTAAIYALSSAVALLVLFRTRQARVRHFLSYAAAGVVGGAATAGSWWWGLWTHYGNPLFPYFNNVFQSPYLEALAFTDRRFVPDHLWEYLVWPILFTRDSLRVGGLRFADMRFAVLFLLYLAAGPRLLTGPKTRQQLFHPRAAGFLTIFFALSFVLWMIAYSIYRYLICLELLVPVIFLVLLERVTSSDRMRAALAVLSLLAVYTVFHPASWGRTGWDDPYVSIRTSEPLEGTEGAVVVMLGQAPMAHVIPQFPSTTRFVRPEGNLHLRSEDLLFQKIETIVKQQKATGRALFLLFSEADASVNLNASAVRLGLKPSPLPDCITIDTSLLDRLQLCRIPE